VSRAELYWSLRLQNMVHNIDAASHVMPRNEASLPLALEHSNMTEMTQEAPKKTQGKPPGIKPKEKRAGEVNRHLTRRHPKRLRERLVVIIASCRIAQSGPSFKIPSPEKQ
jgi:hypothetical protein